MTCFKSNLTLLIFFLLTITVHSPVKAQVCTSADEQAKGMIYRPLPKGTGNYFHLSNIPASTPAHSDEFTTAHYRQSLWPDGCTIHICFLDGSATQRQFVKQVAVEWLKFTNVKFEFVDGRDDNADVSVSFQQTNRTWSKLGTGAQYVPKGQPTMNYGWPLVGQNGRGDVLHEFGHMLGRTHEHQQPGAPIIWNLEKIKEESGWDLNTIKSNILDQYGEAVYPFDADSIMLYSFPAEWTKNGFATKRNNILSAQDKEWATAFYPKTVSEPTPTTQETHWVMKDTYIGIKNGQDIWQWSIFIDGPDVTKIEKVVYYLHPSFNPSVVQITSQESGFRLNSSGYGTFLIRADVFWKGLSVPTRSEIPLRFMDGPQMASIPSKNSSLSLSNTAQITDVKEKIDNHVYFRYDWTVHLTGSDELLKQVKCVVYYLHPTFPNPIRQVTSSPENGFALSSNGWAPFPVTAIVYFKNGSTKELKYMLNFTKQK